MKNATEVLEYLHAQFPATIGHIPLKEMLIGLEISSMKKAAEICDKKACEDFVHTNSALANSCALVKSSILSAITELEKEQAK